MKPAALGATESQATNGVLAASYVSGTHMWKGNAAILNPKPANAEEAEREERLSRGGGPGHRREVGGAHRAVDEGKPVHQQRRGDAPDEEELERRLDRLLLALEEARQDVERDRHQLEGDEQQDQVAGGGEDEHPQERRQDEQVVLAGASHERGLHVGQGGEQPDERRDEEEALGEDREAVLHEHAAERGRRGPHEEARQGEDQHAPRGDPADHAPVAAPDAEVRDEHEQQEGPEPDLQRERAHRLGAGHRCQGPAIRASRSVVAVSIGPIATPGAMPKSTSTATRSTSATQSGPRASSRSWKCGEGGPQKICLATRTT